MIFSNDDQKNKYHQVWKEIFKLVDNKTGELNLHEKIVLPDIDIYTDELIKIPSVTIVIMSLVEKKKIFRTCIKSLFVPALALSFAV